MGFGLVKVSAIQNLGRDSSRAQVFVFGADRLHLLVICRHPQSPACLILARRRELGRQFLPKLRGIVSERELGRGIVHHYHVTHPRSRGATAWAVGFEQRDLASGRAERVGAGGSNNSSAHDDDMHGQFIGKSSPFV